MGMFSNFLLAYLLGSIAVTRADLFNVRQNLSTASRYDDAKMLTNHLILDDNILPDSTCSPIHLNLVGRHGTRAPTKKRIYQLDLFATRVRSLAQSSLRAPQWMREWESPWRGRTIGGELLSKGEEEMFDLGHRLRVEFENIFKEEYHPDLYRISTTQVPRSAASAVAFGMGLFAGKGTLGPGFYKAFAVMSDSRMQDKHLRFYETCETYKTAKASGGPIVSAIQEEYFAKIAAAMLTRLDLNVTTYDVATLWFLCKQEAAALDIVDHACALFTPEEVELLEWTDDIEVYLLKGYGKSINYRMGIPLLENVFESMQNAMLAKEASHASSSVERAHLRFAHAETVIPFLCLLGLFLDDADVQKVRTEQPLQLPSPPPQYRKWRGSVVAPYAVNTKVVLYQCSSNTSAADEYMVQVFHNEKSMALPACNGAHFCPLETFKEQVVAPHLKHNFESLCLLEEQVHECSWGCYLRRFWWKLLQIFETTDSHRKDAEL